MDNEIRNKIERMKIKAEELQSENVQAFIVDSNNTFYFCDIIIVGENKITFEPFKGNGQGETIRRFWADILDVREYVDREVGK